MTTRRGIAHAARYFPYEGPKALRLGIVEHSKLIEELLVVPRRHVTVGPDPTATVVVPREDLATTLRMFELSRGSYYLNFTAEMKGQVSQKTGFMDLTELRRRSKRVRQSGSDVYRVPWLSRGTIVVGSTKILFQLIPLDPLAPADEVGPPARSFAHRLGAWLTRR